MPASLRDCVPPNALKAPAYLEHYERHLDPVRSNVRAVLELGVHEGGSLLMWRDYFPDAVVAGLDVNGVRIADDTGRVRFYQGSQDDLALLDRIAGDCAPSGFDLIIDDCSHVGDLAKKSFWHLFDRHLKETGVYVIEDWGTGYWDHWADGRQYEFQADRKVSHDRKGAPKTEFRSHLAGMPGFVKQLIDECAMTDIRAGGSAYQSPHRLIGRLDIYMAQVFVFPFREGP